jgi:hypothetical protein
MTAAQVLHYPAAAISTTDTNERIPAKPPTRVPRTCEEPCLVEDQ